MSKEKEYEEMKKAFQDYINARGIYEAQIRLSKFMELCEKYWG